MRKHGFGKLEEPKKLEDELAETEMCDVCGKSFNYTFIKRFDYCSPKGTRYVVRCCPYCNITTILSKLI